MKISTKGRYGLRLMLELSGSGHSKISLNQVAKRQEISEKYLWQIANRLKTAGLIESVPGASGGFVLNKAPKDVSLADILEALEGETTLAPCVKKSTLCSRSASCASRQIWRELNAKLNDLFRSVSLSDVMKKQAKIKTDSSSEYNI